MKNSPSLALVTGANSGIGKALCQVLAKQKINLIITGRRAEALSELRRELSSQIEVEEVVVDLADSSARQTLIQKIHERTPDLVINNAGLGLYGDVLSYPLAKQQTILEVNGMALLELTVEAARWLVSKGKKGTILNVSSAAAFQIFPSSAVYAASKAFVNAFSQAFDEEVRDQGVRVLVACPGMVDTPFQGKAGGKIKGERPWGVMTPEFVADRIWEQIQRQKEVLIIDWKYAFMTYLSFLVPKRLRAQLLKQVINKRIKP